MSNNEDLVIVESTDYAQVVFDDVKDNYNYNKQLECSFALNELLKADHSDWIGIYKVGFTNCDDHVCLANVGLDSIKDGKGKVVFSSESLPKEDVEFYQFVYVSQSKHIRGASVPFQFYNESSDLIEEEEQDAVVIKYEINETITEIKSRCEKLAKSKETYEKLVKDNEEMIKSLKEEVAAIKLKCFRLTMDNEKLNFTLRTKADNLKTLADTINGLTAENDKLQTKFNEITNENKTLLETLQQYIDQITQLKTELESVRANKSELENVLNLKENELEQLKKDKDELNRIADDLQRINDQIVGLEKQVDERVEELNKIKNDLKKNETIVSEQATTIQNILNERNALNEVIERLSKEKGNLETNQENLSQELLMSKDKLLAAEQCKEMLRAQLVVVSDELEEATKKVDSQLVTIKQLNDKLADSELEKSALTEKLNNHKQESEQRLDQVNGLYHTLRLAHTHLESRLKSSEQKRDLVEKQNEIQKKTIEQLEMENEELKERVRAGAKEYTKLFERFRFLKNQQFNNDINVYHDLSSGDVHLRRNNPRNSTPSEERDSAIQDKTMSQSARASTDIENTLLDALLGSSFMNSPWSANTSRDIKQTPSTHSSTNQQQVVLSATTTQPKSQCQAICLNDESHLKNVATVSSQPPAVATQQQTPQNIQIQVEQHHQQVKQQIQSHQQHIQQQIQQHQLKIQQHQQQTQQQQQQQNIHQQQLPLQNRQSSSTIYQSINDQNIQLNNNYTCEYCDYIFPTDVSQIEIENHFSTHFGPTCPVCNLQFKKGFSQSDYENHVQSHFPN